jgi:hypothetical protein
MKTKIILLLTMVFLFISCNHKENTIQKSNDSLSMNRSALLNLQKIDKMECNEISGFTQFFPFKSIIERDKLINDTKKIGSLFKSLDEYLVYLEKDENEVAVSELEKLKNKITEINDFCKPYLVLLDTDTNNIAPQITQYHLTNNIRANEELEKLRIDLNIYLLMVRHGLREKIKIIKYNY